MRHIESMLFSADVDVLSTLVTTKPGFDIRRALLEQGADLLVVPAEQMVETKGFPVGEKLQSLLKDYPVPIWRLGVKGTLSPKRMLLVLDDDLLCDETNLRLSEWTVLFARLMEAEMHVLREVADKNIPSSSPRRRGSTTVVDSRLRGNDGQPVCFVMPLPLYPPGLHLMS